DEVNDLCRACGEERRLVSGNLHGSRICRLIRKSRLLKSCDRRVCYDAGDVDVEHYARGSGMMIGQEVALATNRSGWNKVAPLFHGTTALPEYGPLAPTEDSLMLLDEVSGSRVLELGCGSGHSLRYLAERGAQELWGIDLSPVQIAFA